MPRLTKTYVDGLGPKTKPYANFDTGKGAITGFLVRIYPTGRKAAYFQYRLKGAGRRGKPKAFRIGEISGSGMTFTMAQDRAKALRAIVELGGNPAQDEKARALAVVETEELAKERTFKALADSWLKKKAKLRSYTELERIVNSTLVDIHKRPVAELRAGDLDSLINDIEGRAPFMALRALQVIQWVLDHGIKRHWIAANPARHIELQADNRSAGRDRVLSDEELVRIWNAADGMGWPYGRAVQMLILTAARRNEVAALKWPEIDAAHTMWHLPAERAKNGEAHDAHLAAETLNLLKSHPDCKEDKLPVKGFVFSNGAKPIAGFSKYKRALDDEILEAIRKDDPKGKIIPWRIHDIRRTAATHMAGMGFGLAVVERVLNHRGVSRTGVAGIYQRAEFLPERKAALDAWAKRVTALVTRAEPASNLVSISEKKRA
jgi:integrase